MNSIVSALRYNLGPGLNIVVGRAPYLLQLLQLGDFTCLAVNPSIPP
jgi:hypothetical protein